MNAKAALPGTALAALLLLGGCEKAPEPAPVTTSRPMAIDTPPPVYPAELACDGTGGQVVLMLTIGVEGKPTEARMLQSSRIPALDAAAQEAVRNWRFEPAKVNEKPVPAKINVPITFSPPKVRPAECFVLDEKKRKDKL
ncbi:energy transducer TonB [Lysobacter niastensis]|uniref:Energy transducer TonB n=1 Tax=Lysobacter niastensis TaxID=380629 RepID=A0ABS0B6W1_9GAMM|nr:energy transducer TonB [Lysobacter niastensis]MBF6024760.1 energy transducer TonB [Lysobacter niastensis]